MKHGPEPLRVFAVIIFGLCFLASTSCGPKESAPASSPALDKVSLRLQWFPLAQFAGFYTAEDKGYYKDAGFDVTINPGGPDFNAISLVANGSDTFGIWTADQILVAASKGVPISIVAAIYRKDPNVLMVKKGSTIRGPKDFVGKRVTTVFGRATESVLMAMLEKAGVDPKRVKIEPFPFNVNSFVAGQVDVSAAYVYDHPFQAKRMGVDVDLIDPADYGINFYSDCLFVRNDLIAKNPELVGRFVAATLRGWEYALDHQEEAVTSVLARTEGLDRESQAYMLEHAKPLIRYEDPERLGRVSAASLEAMAATLRKQGVLTDNLDVNSAFTNQFVDAFYGR